MTEFQEMVGTAVAELEKSIAYMKLLGVGVEHEIQTKLARLELPGERTKDEKTQCANRKATSHEADKRVARRDF